MNATKQNNTQNNDDQFFDSLLQQLKLVIDNELLLSRTSLLVNSLESIFKEFNTTLDRRPKTIDFHILYREQMASIFSACQTKTSNSYYSSTREELRSLRELRCTETTLQLAIRLLKDASLMLADKHVNFDILRMLFKLDLDFHGFFNQKQCPQATSIWDELQTAKLQRLELIVNLFDSDYIPDKDFPLVLPILTPFSEAYWGFEVEGPIWTEVPMRWRVRLTIASMLLKMQPCDYSKAAKEIKKLRNLVSNRFAHVQHNIRMCYRGYSADEFNRIEKPLLLQTDLLLCKQAAQICFANNDTSDAEHAWRQALEAYEALEELATAGYPVNLPTEAIKEIEDYFQAAYPHPPSSP